MATPLSDIELVFSILLFAAVVGTLTPDKAEEALKSCVQKPVEPRFTVSAHAVDWSRQ